MNNFERSKVQGLTHGLPYKSRNKEPSMFEILAWNTADQQTNYPTQQCETFNKNSPKRTHQTCNHSLQNKQNRQNLQQKNKYKPNFLSSPHKYKHQLYTYNDEETKTNKIIQDATKNIIQQTLSPHKNTIKNHERSKSKSLNPNNVQDPQEIKNRKNKIKNFKMLSRQLPDSAFTTYFGKPAFSNYGSGSNSAQKKSFNVMPHAGKNHPEYQQSYQGALKKGKQINLNYVPKKPIEIYHPEEGKFIQSDYYQIPIKKPNLLHSNRFTEDKSFLQRKARTPRHDQLNSLSARQSFHKDQRLKTSHESRNKLRKATSSKGFDQVKNDYPLVQSRDHLREILQEKKRQENKIAYKVTECYPLTAQNCSKQCETRLSRWNEMRPAGVVSPRSDHADDVFYPNKIWG